MRRINLITGLSAVLVVAAACGPGATPTPTSPAATTPPVATQAPPSVAATAAGRRIA